jgi:uncharacterized protein
MGIQIASNTGPDSFPPREATPNAIESAGKHMPVASRLHLAIFLALQIVVILRSGTVLPRLIAIKDEPTFHFRLACYYGLIIFFEFAQLLFVWYGIKKTNTKISDLVGGRWSSAWALVKDVFLAGALWLLWMLTTIVLAIALQPQQRGIPDFYKILPRSPLEVSLWIGISVSAGFCEEIVFRGYLQRQFLGLWQNLPLAITCQAVVFAAVHRYQGTFNVLGICAMAILFGALASRRNSLRPGILAHMWHDALVGVAFFLVHHFG